MTSFHRPGPFGLTDIRDALHGGTLSRAPASRPGIVGGDSEATRQLERPPTSASSSAPAQNGTARSNADEKRVIDVIHARRPNFDVEGRWFRLIRAGQWSTRYEDGHDVVALSEARPILAQAASARTTSKPERAAFEEAASLLADPNARRLESGLLLLRIRPAQRYVRSGTEAAVTPSQLVRGMKKEKEETEHWIEIELALPDGKSVAHERFLIVTPDDREIAGVTDSHGRARVDGIVAEGACKISFPDLYDDEWRRA